MVRRLAPPGARSMIILSLALGLVLTSMTPAWAAEQYPEPFCGDLDQEDCAVLHASTQAMFSLESYSTAVAYTLYQHGLPELPPESKAEFRIEGSYAFDEDARTAMRTLAVISRKEPLAAVEAIGESPDLLITLYSGMTADLVLTLDLSESWTRTLEDEVDIEWPEITNVQVRLVDGVLYFGIHELKAIIPELAGANDWVAIELVDALTQLAEAGALRRSFCLGAGPDDAPLDHNHAFGLWPARGALALHGDQPPPRCNVGRAGRCSLPDRV
jgi:hypothetical protein